MRRPASIKLMDAFGIRVGVDAGWFLTLFLVIIWLSPSFRRSLHSSDGVAYLTTVISALLFFGSLIAHELGHALVARRHGLEVRRIELFLFGGFTHVTPDPRTPGEEFKVAAAGPLATLGMVALVCALDLAIVGPHRLWHAFILDSNVRVTPVLLGLSWLLLMNAIVLVFNLVPAFPLDGGRMVRALVWRVSGERSRGTRAAAKLGQGFAVVLGGIGVWLMLAGGTLAGLWLVLMAFLLGQAARAALLSSAVSERIEGVRVADIMDPQPVAIPAATPVAQALEEFFLRYGWSWFPVIDEDGRFVGLAREERLAAARDGGEGWLTVASLIEDGGATGWYVNEERPLSELVSSERLARLGALMAVDGEGVLRGVVTIEQVRRALHSALAQPLVD